MTKNLSKKIFFNIVLTIAISAFIFSCNSNNDEIIENENIENIVLPTNTTIPIPVVLPEKYIKATIAAYVEQTVTALPITEPIEIVSTVIVEKVEEKIIEQTVIVEKFIEIPISVIVTATPTITPTPENTPTPLPTSTSTPAPTITPTPIPTPTPMPTSTPTPGFQINPGTTPKGTAGASVFLNNARVVRDDGIQEFSAFSSEIKWKANGNWETLPSLDSAGKITGSHGYMSTGVYEITIRVSIGNVTKQIQFNAIVN